MAKKEMSIQAKASDPQKGIALTLKILLATLGFILVLVVFFFIMRLIFDLMKFMPWLDYVFAVFMVCVPAAVFITAYSIFFNRTLHYQIKPVKLISLGLMAVVVVGWVYLLIHDLLHFFRTEKLTIDAYLSYEKTWLVASVALIFIIGIVQALSLPKEEDWIAKAAKKNMHI